MYDLTAVNFRAVVSKINSSDLFRAAVRLISILQPELIVL
jgi:hypothetical protein